MRTRAAWWAKANAYAQAWAERFGAPPDVTNTALGLAVAEHETRCGDAWPGHNWGACTKGALTATQRTALEAAGVHPVLNPSASRDAAEDAATAALAAAGCPVPSDAEIHVDSSPLVRAYFTLFGRFDSDVEGASYFVHVLAEQRTSCRRILENNGGAYNLAAAMYRSHYYTGFHNPHAPGGDDANIHDYADAIAAIGLGTTLALTSWSPGADPANIPLDPSTGLGLQQMLNALGAVPRLTEDGIVGPKTRGALATWQAATGLSPSGSVNPPTAEKLRAALRALR